MDITAYANGATPKLSDLSHRHAIGDSSDSGDGLSGTCGVGGAFPPVPQCPVAATLSVAEVIHNVPGIF